MKPWLTNEYHAVHSIDTLDRLRVRDGTGMPPAPGDFLRPVRHDEVPLRVHEAVGDLFVVGILDPIVVVIYCVAEELLAWCLIDTKWFI